MTTIASSVERLILHLVPCRLRPFQLGDPLLEFRWFREYTRVVGVSFSHPFVEAGDGPCSGRELLSVVDQGRIDTVQTLVDLAEADSHFRDDRLHSAVQRELGFGFVHGIVVHGFSAPCFPFVVRPSSAISSARFFSVRFFDCSMRRISLRVSTTSFMPAWTKVRTRRDLLVVKSQDLSRFSLHHTLLMIPSRTWNYFADFFFATAFSRLLAGTEIRDCFVRAVARLSGWAA